MTSSLMDFDICELPSSKPDSVSLSSVRCVWLFCMCVYKDSAIHLLPPANEVAGRQCFQSYVSVCSQRGPITHDALDITIQRTPHSPLCTGTPQPQPSLLISGDQDRRPVQTCSLEAPHDSDIRWPRLETC